MLSRFHKEICTQDAENVKWDSEDLSQFHKSRKIAQLLRYLESCEIGRIEPERKKHAGSRYVAGMLIYCSCIES